jgi:hypothetical protein
MRFDCVRLETLSKIKGVGLFGKLLDNLGFEALSGIKGIGLLGKLLDNLRFERESTVGDFQ